MPTDSDRLGTAPRTERAPFWILETRGTARQTASHGSFTAFAAESVAILAG